jgi:hypothetical protein
MAPYQPTIRKFCGNENSVQWLEDYISEIEAPGGPGPSSKHVYFCQCLEGAADDWYCNILEYEPKVYWDLLQAAFSSHWNPVTCDIRTVEVSLNLAPPGSIPQPLTTYVPPAADCAANTTLNWATDVDESIDFVPIMSVNVNPILIDTPMPVEPIPVMPISQSGPSPVTCAPIVHGPRDLSGLRSGVQNPWGSLHHRNRRSNPLQMNHPYSQSKPLRHFPSHTLRTEPVQPHLRPPSVPVHIVQTIQHPRGISSTKPKITKIIPITSQHPVDIQKQFTVARCACGRNITPVYPRNQSWMFAGTRRRFGRRGVSTWGEIFSDQGRGHSRFGRGIQAWGPRFRERGYMDQLHWSQNRRPRIGTRRSHVDRPCS